MRGTSWLAVVMVVVLGSAVGIAAGTFLAWYMDMNSSGMKVGLTDLFTDVFEGKDQVRVLFIGEDDTSKRNKNGHGLSDTLVVMALDTRTKEVRAISIPRDTRVEIPGHGTSKINAAHVFGGPELTREVVKDLLGVPIDYYVATNTEGLRGLVDLVGGVYIKIDKNMRYTDRRGGLYINLKAGPEKQLLNGEQAEGFVRFRHDRFGDSGYEIVDGKKVPRGRIVRQQIFMRALANRVMSLPTKRERAEVLKQAHEKGYIVSDLKLKDWGALADFFKDFDETKMAMDVLPGQPGSVHGASYWLPDYEAIGELVARNMLFQGPVNTEDAGATVEVLNGSGIAGAAGKVAEKLREAGFEVTRTDNADSFGYTRCCIIAHKGKNERVERLAALLNCDDIRVESTASEGADVTVIVGRDFNEN